MTEQTRTPPRSAVLLAWMSKLPTTGVFLGALVVLLVGLFWPGLVGSLILLAVAAGMVALLRVTWAVQTPQKLLMRITILVALVGLALIKLF